MLFLIASIACTSLLYILFKAFGDYQIPALPAIIINYLTAAVIGFLFVIGNHVSISDIPVAYLLFTAILGAAFFAEFNLMQQTTILLGVSGSTIVSRMSLVIPATVSIFVFREPFTFWKTIGIFLSLVSIFFAVYQKKNGMRQQGPSTRRWVIPVITFLGIGAVDTSLKTAEVHFLHHMSQVLFVTVLYSFAFITGMFILVFQKKAVVKEVVRRKTIAAGVLLGIINFFSIYFFVLTLTRAGLQGSQLFPINSVGIVVLSTVLSILLFKEKLTRYKTTGLVLALLAIYLISHAG